METKLLFLFNVILAFYTIEGFTLTGVRFKHWDNKYFIRVIPRGGCSFCVCLDEDFVGESRGNDICPFCYCVSSYPN
ncbi:unnamed protein product [Trichobilharzia szidati]|nr:unnamed protein product [Trichobilharzia szidati]